MSLEIEYIDKPIKVSKLPLDKVYVIDNYLPTVLWHQIDTLLTNAMIWSKTNSVHGQSRTGLPHHSFWGASFFRGPNKMTEIDNLQVLSLMGAIDSKVQNDFGFRWIRFQYMGLNSQTQGLHGTTHSDCDQEDDYNLSFLYYYNKFWNPHWGGKLRFYDEPQQGLDGRNEHIENHQIGEVDFVPNRLLMFDGRIPHGADAPNERARYADRRSIVLRGDEVELCLQ